MNSFVITGRLVADPELRQTKNDIPVCNFRVAVDRKTKPGAEKKTDYINCTCWRGGAETIAKYFKKGSKIAVRGPMQSEEYTNKDGVKCVAWSLVVEDFEFCDCKSVAGSEEKRPQYVSPFAEVDDVDAGGELPF